jgi:hypothetical protein
MTTVKSFKLLPTCFEAVPERTDPMSDSLFSTDAPLALEMAARRERDRYLADLLRAAGRAVWTALFGTRQSAHDAAVSLQDCYVRDNALTAMPDADALAARRSNDHHDRHGAAA